MNCIGTYLDFDQRHQSAAGLECDVSGNWSIGSVFRYGSGFPYTPVDGLQKDISTHGALDGWQIIKGAKNSRRYPIYSRVDLRITYKHKGNSWDMSAYLDFMNVLNNKNVYLYEWDFTSNSNSGVSLAKKKCYIYASLCTFLWIEFPVLNKKGPLYKGPFLLRW